jgi:hypothetical protein
MPIAFMTSMLLDQVTAGRIIEPIKKNQYRLLLQITNILTVLENQYKEDADYLETIKTSMVGNLYPIEITFTPPTIQVETRRTKGTGNVEVKYGGWVTYGDAQATFHNFIGLDTYKFFYRWAAMAGALFMQRNNDVIQIVSPTAALPVPDLAPDATSGGYKVNATVSTYHTLDTSVGDETENARWILQGVFPTSVSPGDYNHADDGEPVLTTVNFSVDMALPAQPAQSS